MNPAEASITFFIIMLALVSALVPLVTFVLPVADIGGLFY